MRFAAAATLALLLGATAGTASADELLDRGRHPALRPSLEGNPEPRGSAGGEGEDRTKQIERLVLLEHTDPAAFRDLLRRNLSARLLWAVTGRPLPPDLPVELAGP